MEKINLFEKTLITAILLNKDLMDQFVELRIYLDSTEIEELKRSLSVNKIALFECMSMILFKKKEIEIFGT